MSCLRGKDSGKKYKNVQNHRGLKYATHSIKRMLAFVAAQTHRIDSGLGARVRGIAERRGGGESDGIPRDLHLDRELQREREGEQGIPRRNGIPYEADAQQPRHIVLRHGQHLRAGERQQPRIRLLHEPFRQYMERLHKVRDAAFQQCEAHHPADISAGSRRRCLDVAVEGGWRGRRDRHLRGRRARGRQRFRREQVRDRLRGEPRFRRGEPRSCR